MRWLAGAIREQGTRDGNCRIFSDNDDSASIN